MDDWIGLRRHTGGFDLQAVEDASDTKLAVIVKARGWDEFARLMIEVESKPPYRTTALTARLIPRPVDIAPPTRLTERQLLSILPGKLERAATDDHFSGAVMIAKAGMPIYSAAFGHADRERKIPNTVETKFRIGSMNKLFTAVAVLQLVQGGRVDLSDSIGTYLPDYPNPDAGAKLTIDHLLTHTGGTGDIFGPDFMAHREDLRELADYVTLHGKQDLLFEPGSRWDYSNYGFVLLGVVIERVTGESYYDVVRNAIFDPAGMTGTELVAGDNRRARAGRGLLGVQVEFGYAAVSRDLGRRRLLDRRRSCPLRGRLGVEPAAQSRVHGAGDDRQGRHGLVR